MSTRAQVVKTCVALAAIVGLAAVAAAQPPGGGMRGPGMMGGLGGAMLLQSPQVQQELKLTDDQKTKLRQMGERVRNEITERMAELQGLSEDERRTKADDFRKQADKIAEAVRKEAAGILQPEQIKRWKQIELQQQGASALLRPEIAEAIGLSDEQKQSIKKITDESQAKLQGMFAKMRDRDNPPSEEERSQMREQSQKLRQEGEANAMAVLKPEQKDKLKEMMGTPFKLDRSRFEGRRNRSQQ